MSKRFAGTVGLVTGASKGIGAAIARRLAADGVQVAVNYSADRAAAERVVAEITSSGGRAVAVQADLSRADEIGRLFDAVERELGPADLLVNNAGRYGVTPVGSLTEELFHAHFNLNVLGVLLASQEAAKRFGDRGGTIVNISSVVAQMTPPGVAIYSATKGAVDAITRALARELAPARIRVNAVAPGLIATEGTHAVGLVTDPETPHPLGPVGKPDDIAAVVAFLASDEARWINGQILTATGQLL